MRGLRNFIFIYGGVSFIQGVNAVLVGISKNQFPSAHAFFFNRYILVLHKKNSLKLNSRILATLSKQDVGNICKEFSRINVLK